MKVESLHITENCRIINVLLFVLSCMLMTECFAVDNEKGIVQITYNTCGIDDKKSISMSTPDSSVFPHNNFLNETVILKYERQGAEWVINMDAIEQNKRYTRQAVWLVEDTVLPHDSSSECISFHVKFTFSHSVRH